MCETYQTRQETMHVQEGACLSTCQPQMACSGGIVYQLSLVVVSHVYSSKVRWTGYLTSYEVLTTQIVWMRIKATVLHR